MIYSVVGDNYCHTFTKLHNAKDFTIFNKTSVLGIWKTLKVTLLTIKSEDNPCKSHNNNVNDTKFSTEIETLRFSTHKLIIGTHYLTMVRW